MSTSKYRADRTDWPGAPGHMKKLKEIWWNVQPPPYKASLEYRTVHQECVSCIVYNESDPSQVNRPVPFLFSGAPDTSGNRAYEAFSSAVSDEAAWGANLGEAKQSMGMVENRVLQVARFAGALRKGHFGDAAKILGVSKPSGLKSGAKNFADNFLEFHFGWEPAIQDIYSSLNVLTKSDFGWRKIRGAGHSNPVVNGYDASKGRWTASWNCTTKMGAMVRISNESSFLANQLGLLNPLAVAWELVPYSFVADWFGNIGQVINSLTGFVGLEMAGQYTVTVYDGKFISNYHSDDGKYFEQQVHKNLYVYRDPLVKGPTLQLKPFQGFSPMRGITAISLLLQKL